jgi:hypothetical protein
MWCSLAVFVLVAPTVSAETVRFMSPAEQEVSFGLRRQKAFTGIDTTLTAK